jgi:hypothetical protein
MSIINFEDPAHTFSKGPSGEPNPLKKSSPPKNINSPNITAQCIKSFFLSGTHIANIDKINIGTPNIEGINEVMDVLSLMKVIRKPHVKRHMP